MDAFDAGALIYAATPGHVLGERVRRLFDEHDADGPVGLGSVLLLPEVLSRYVRGADPEDEAAMLGLLERLDVRPVDAPIAQLATAFRATHGLKTVDAVHLATAVRAGADRFITNNQRDFSASIEEVDIVYPEDLPDP